MSLEADLESGTEESHRTPSDLLSIIQSSSNYRFGKNAIISGRITKCTDNTDDNNKIIHLTEPDHFSSGWTDCGESDSSLLSPLSSRA